MSQMDEASQFGWDLVKTGDLDPVYIGVDLARFPEGQLARLLVAYWCFYHLGASAWLSDLNNREFWEMMDVAARNEVTPPVGTSGRWPRGAERRHFRGAKCVAAVEYLRKRDPIDLVADLAKYRTECEVMDAAGKWPMFGPWIGFKIADMMERCWHATIRFSDDIVLMYSEPRAALDILDPDDPKGAYMEMLDRLQVLNAPPAKDRKCGPQELETVLCKWKSSLTRHYWVGKDIHEVRHGLEGWGPAADRILGEMPDLVTNGHSLKETAGVGFASPDHKSRAPARPHLR